MNIRRFLVIILLPFLTIILISCNNYNSSEGITYTVDDLFNAAKTGNKDIVIKIAKVNKVGIDTKDSFGTTPLVFALLCANYDIAKFLIEKGADVNVKDYHTKRTPCYAFKNGYKEIAKYIEEKQ